jgi:hypothetical protein
VTAGSLIDAIGGRLHQGCDPAIQYSGAIDCRSLDELREADRLQAPEEGLPSVGAMRQIYDDDGQIQPVCLGAVAIKLKIHARHVLQHR